MSLNAKTLLPSVSERRGQHLAPLQTNFSRPTSQLPVVALPRPQRPRPSDYDNGQASERVPLQPAHVKRQSSKSSLRHIFGREKSARKFTDAKLSDIEEVQNQVKQTPAGSAAPLSPSACVTPRTTTSTPTLVNSSPIDSRRSKLPAKHLAKPSDSQQSTDHVGWKPPPLFQAYPQAIKHTTLLTPALSADSIVRLHATFKARASGLEDPTQQGSQSSNGEPTDDLAARRKKFEKEKKKYLRTLSESIEKNEWSQKVYVLVTAGYILQYPSGGKYDRLPEKMLLLGPKSVAFASDAIPGKHWVLQVSQTSDEESTNPSEPSRPIFSRLGFHRSYTRRLARNFLLVFNDPDEMSSWLLAVRAQIEARGGKKYVTERVFDDDMEGQLRTTPSMRQLVKKDPNRFSTMLLQPQQSQPSDERDSNIAGQSSRNSYISLHRRSMVMQPTPESRSGSISTVQTEVISNADDSGRFYAAIGSPPLPDGSVLSEAASSLTGPHSPTFSSPKKRRSMFLPQMSSSEIAEIPRAQSTVPESHFRCMSPPAPNFSVPSFSKRFAARPDLPQVPHLPSIHSDQLDDASADTLSLFSSPPQSPGREMHHGVPGDSRDQRRPLNRRDFSKKQIRESTSQDSLGDNHRDQDRSRLPYPRFPGDGGTALSTAPNTDPVDDTTSELAAALQFPKPPSELDNLSHLRDQRARTSLYCKSDSTSRPSSTIMSRRKSLSGLSVGPPVAPPPNCPLPKIPSAYIKPSPQSSWPKGSPPMSPMEGPDKSLHASSHSTNSISSRQMIQGV